VIRVKRKLNSTDVVDALTDLFILRGPPEFIRSDNGAEFIAKKVRAWIGAVGAKTAFIAPGSPWENGYCESFRPSGKSAADQTLERSITTQPFTIQPPPLPAMNSEACSGPFIRQEPRLG
jgi:transposase InsO family protein